MFINICNIISAINQYKKNVTECLHHINDMIYYPGLIFFTTNCLIVYNNCILHFNIEVYAYNMYIFKILLNF